MATRPVFIPIFESDSLIKKDNIEFQYYSGFSVGQKQKSIASLHEAIHEKYMVMIPVIEENDKVLIYGNIGYADLLEALDL